MIDSNSNTTTELRMKSNFKNYLSMILLLALSNAILAQNIDGLYEFIDSTTSFGAKEIMIKIENKSVELYTLPKAYNIGVITANKGRLIEQHNNLHYQIDSTWLFSSNFVHLRNLKINCIQKIELEFNSDSTVLNLKMTNKLKVEELEVEDESMMRFKAICGCIEDYEELRLNKVEYFQNEFDWNCGSYKYWKRQLNSDNIIDCSK